MTSNPVGTTHAAMVKQLFGEARSAERGDEPSMAASLRHAARIIERVDMYRAGWEHASPPALESVDEYPQPRHSYVDDYHV